MGDKLEVYLKVTLDRTGLERQLGHVVESDFAFYLLGLVGSQLAHRFGESCAVDLESVTGLEAGFLRSMNDFAKRHQRAVASLRAYGEVVLDDRELVEVFELLYDVMIVPMGNAWLVTQRGSAVPQ